MVCAAAEKSPKRLNTATSSRMATTNDRIVRGLSSRFLSETPSASASLSAAVTARGTSAKFGRVSAIFAEAGDHGRGRQQEADQDGNAVDVHVVHQIMDGQRRKTAEQAQRDAIPDARRRRSQAQAQLPEGAGHERQVGGQADEARFSRRVEVVIVGVAEDQLPAAGGVLRVGLDVVADAN